MEPARTAVIEIRPASALPNHCKGNAPSCNQQNHGTGGAGLQTNIPAFTSLAESLFSTNPETISL